MKEVTDIQAKAEADAGGVRIVIPLEITVRIGDSGASVSDVSAGSLSPSRPAPLIAKPGSPEAAAAAIRQHIQTNPNVVGVRATYLFHDGELSDEKGVVIQVRPEASRDPRTTASNLRLAVSPFRSRWPIWNPSPVRSYRKKLLKRRPKCIAYKRDLSDPKFKLDPITDDMTLTLHVSPEAGWRELSKFFDGDDYDRTLSACIILRLLTSSRPSKMQSSRTVAR
jgi:hypothetical protein